MQTSMGDMAQRRDGIGIMPPDMGPAPAERTPWLIRLALAGALLVFFVAIAVIYQRYLSTPPTDCNIVIIGNRNLQDAVVTVDDVETSSGRDVSLKVILQEENAYLARFFLPSGTYHVRMVLADGKVLIEDEPYVPPGRSCIYNAAARFPLTPNHSTMPATAPAVDARESSNGKRSSN